MNNKLLLLDADSLLYQCASKDTFAECLSEFDIRLRSILSKTNTSYYIGFLTESNCFRYRIDANYKANRKDSVRPKFLKSLEVYSKEVYGFCSYSGLEADDLVALAVDYFNRQQRDTVVASIDKDVLNQIVGTHFDYYYDKNTSAYRGEHVTTEQDSIKFLFKQVLMGDSTDNIKGIPGIGEKKAMALLAPITTLNPQDYYIHCLKIYNDICGQLIGPTLLNTTYRLVKLLYTETDLKNEFNLLGLPQPTSLGFDFNVRKLEAETEW